MKFNHGWVAGRHHEKQKALRVKRLLLGITVATMLAWVYLGIKYAPMLLGCF